jgi:hypothetical protein
MRAVVVTVAAWACATAFADEAANQHLLAGVRAFRASQFELALSELQQAGGATDLSLYLGPTLYKLGRLDEARLVLAALHRSGRSDAVADYYLGMTWYRLGLLQLARSLFARIDARDAGPKLADGAARFVAEIDRHPTLGVGLDQLLAAAEALAPSDPRRALDAAEEAFLRAPRGGAERRRAAALLVRIGPAAGRDEIAAAATSEAAPALRR